MKNNSFFKLLSAIFLTACIIVVCLIIIPRIHSGNDGQTVSLDIYHFSESKDGDGNVSETLMEPDESDDADTDRNTPASDGFDMPDDIFIPEEWLGKIRDFQAKIDDEIKRRKENMEQAKEDDDANNESDEIPVPETPEKELQGQS